MSADTHTLHEHEPTEPIAAFEFVCKHCGQLIAPEFCPSCDGVAYVHASGKPRRCHMCKGAGHKRWVLIP